MKTELRYCYDCEQYRAKVEDGVFVCVSCGRTTYGFVNEYIPNIWMHKKSKHSRTKWFRRNVEGFVGYRHADILTGDFEKVLRVMIEHGLVNGKNVSRYGYYFIRLASRRGIELISEPKDLVPGKTKRIFDDRLFGQIYKLLGWDLDCDCPYYLEWKFI